MHELALTAELLRLLENNAREKGIKHIKRVKLVIGALSSVLPEAVEFSFNTLKEGPLFEDAKLEIEEKPVRVRCRDCMAEKAVDHFYPLCPSCGSGRVSIIEGKEFYIDFYEGE
ncbi:hydrogenase maturation nickel metallochaperone HypA [Neomoorella thermoacetica]|uniref:hydrogenase maturation nickel metallochaperone HypA n=1 Tax=Neomoorella thermoacetica TaxID=1525 RepID=UPI0008FB7D30|nr:hydrogenase maturation nickel metallochaperone HypA [Moorella thermoacetica]APC09421.1 hydrogenase/urease nickel incorporation protein HypA [Moorella thermoacetica]